MMSVVYLRLAGAGTLTRSELQWRRDPVNFLVCAKTLREWLDKAIAAGVKGCGVNVRIEWLRVVACLST